MSAGLIEQLLARVEALEAEVSELRKRQAPAELITVAEYAAARSIGVSTVRQAIREGRLAATKYGRSVRVSAASEIGVKATATPAEETPSTFADRVLSKAVAA